MMHPAKSAESAAQAITVDMDAYCRDGFLVLPELFSRAECDALLALSTLLPNYQNGSLVPTMMPHRLQPGFLKAMADPRLVGVMNQLLGGQAMGLQTQFFFGRPGIRGFTAHQDNFYIEAPTDAFASAWLALDDVDAENGGLIVYPGSHLEPILPVQAVEQPTTFGQDPNANNQECVIPEGYQPVNVPAVRRGSVVFIHGHVVHSSNDNVTADRLRRVLLMTYIREGEAYRPGFSAKREAFSLNAVAAQC